MYLDNSRGSATDSKLIIRFDWHILNDNGHYDGWLDLLLIMTPNLANDFDIKIKWYTNGNDKRKVEKYKPLIEDFLYDEWYYILTQEIADIAQEAIRRVNIYHQVVHLIESNKR